MIQVGKIKRKPYDTDSKYINWKGYGCYGTINDKGQIELKLNDWEKYDTFSLRRGYVSGNFNNCDIFTTKDEIKSIFNGTDANYLIFTDDNVPHYIKSEYYYREYIVGRSYILILNIKNYTIICTKDLSDFVNLAEKLIEIYNTKFGLGLLTKGAK